MITFQAVILLVFGAGLLAIDYQSLGSGWLPCGINGLQPLRFHRDERPGMYWLMFVVYGLGGAALLIYGLRILFNLSPPLPWR
jgi:hypothetical protein